MRSAPSGRFRGGGGLERGQSRVLNVPERVSAASRLYWDSMAPRILIRVTLAIFLRFLRFLRFFVVLTKTLRIFYYVLILGERSQPVRSHFRDAGVRNFARGLPTRAKFNKIRAKFRTPEGYFSHVRNFARAKFRTPKMRNFWKIEIEIQKSIALDSTERTCTRRGPASGWVDIRRTVSLGYVRLLVGKVRISAFERRIERARARALCVDRVRSLTRGVVCEISHARGRCVRNFARARSRRCAVRNLI